VANWECVPAAQRIRPIIQSERAVESRIGTDQCYWRLQLDRTPASRVAPFDELNGEYTDRNWQ
jgi:hypothetical protein